MKRFYDIFVVPESINKPAFQQYAMAKNITTLVLLFSLTLLLDGCSRNSGDFENKPFYEIKLGETFDLYVGENSCCRNCFLNQHSMASASFIIAREVESAPEDCDGCTSWYAYTFKGIKPGMDTLKFFNIAPGDTCNAFTLHSFKVKPEFSIVKVTN